MFCSQDMLKYIAVICGFFVFTTALPEKCSKSLDFSSNSLSSLLELLSSNNILDRSSQSDQCRDYKYECKNLSEEEFFDVLEDLPTTCQQKCKLNTTEKSVCDFFKAFRFISSPLFKLPANSFLHFHSLTRLFIENTSIIDIDEKVFYNLKNLDVLSLANNKIRRIHDSTFHDLPMLTELSLQGNHLENFTLIKLPLIEKLILDNNNLESILLEDLVSLSALSLKHNKLKTIRKCFINVESLTTLILEYNRLELIDAADLKGMHNLVHLDMAHNKIRSIDANVFSEMEALHTLHLEDNLLIKLPGHIFTSNTNLGILTLANNHLTDLDMNLFHGLRQLFMLDLDNNAISEIKQETFGIHSENEKHSPADIWIVTLHNNRLQTLDLNIFHQIHTLHLNVSYNQIRSLNMSLLTCDIDASYNNIEELHENGGDLKQIFGTVTDIRLSHNRIKSLNPGQFHRFSQLQNLTLDQNQIAQLPYGVFDGLHSLTFLNLSSNKLDTCAPVVFSDLPQLETLIMSNNDLHSLEIDKILEVLPELKTFDIDLNKWNCDYLHKILLTDAVRKRNDLSFKSSSSRLQRARTLSVKGVSCVNAKEQNVTTDNGISDAHNLNNDVYEKILKLLQERNQQNSLNVAAEPSFFANKEDISKYDDHFRSMKSGIIVLIVFVVIIGLVSVYNIYENRRWRQQSRLNRMSLNTMMEDI